MVLVFTLFLFLHPDVSNCSFLSPAYSWKQNLQGRLSTNFTQLFGLWVCRILISVHTLIQWSLRGSYICFTTKRMITVELVCGCDYVQPVKYQTTLLVRLYCLMMTFDLLYMPLSRVPDPKCHWLFLAGWLIGGCCCVCGAFYSDVADSWDGSYFGTIHTILHCTHYTVHCTTHTMHCVLCTIHHALYTKN